MDIIQRGLLLPTKTPSGGLLPPEYQEVAWIGSTGEQYIDTGVKLTPTSKVKLSLRVTKYDSSQKMGFFGSYDDALYQLYASGSGNRNFYASFGGTSSQYRAIGTFELNTLYEIVMQSGKVAINGAVYDLPQATLTANTNALIFARSLSLPKACMELVKGEIEDNGVLLRSYKKVYHKGNGTIGLYDMCRSISPLTGTPLYTNAGTGVFTKGADV